MQPDHKTLLISGFFSYLHDNEARDVTDSIMFLLIVAKKMLLKCSVKVMARDEERELIYPR